MTAGTPGQGTTAEGPRPATDPRRAGAPKRAGAVKGPGAAKGAGKGAAQGAGTAQGAAKGGAEAAGAAGAAERSGPARRPARAAAKAAGAAKGPGAAERAGSAEAPAPGKGPGAPNGHAAPAGGPAPANGSAPGGARTPANGRAPAASGGGGGAGGGAGASAGVGVCVPERDAEPDCRAEAGAGHPDPDGRRAAYPAAEVHRTSRDIPRWVRWTVLPLLVLVPLGYVIVSADQSHDGSATSVEEAAARRMTAQPPSSLQQRIYQVPVPQGATRVGCLETNSWDTDVLYTQFTTTAGGLDTFLAQIGTSRAALVPGRGAVTAAQAAAAGWGFTAGRGWVGTALEQPGDKPDHAVAVDLTDADAPAVYVVSTVNFQHGFGGG